MYFSVFQYFIKLSKSRHPYFFLGAVALSVFTAEVLVMFFFMVIPQLSTVAEAFLDGTLLVVLFRKGQRKLEVASIG